MTPSLVCRPALPLDTEPVMELTRLIWDGHDYIPDVWSEWLMDSEGLLAVGEFAGTIVAVGKLTSLSPEQWWLEGLRVHPDYRGRGFASHMNEYLLKIWSQRGKGTIRLATHAGNKPIHHLCDRLGFTKVAKLGEYYAPALNSSGQVFQKVSQEDTKKVFSITINNPLVGLVGNLINIYWQHVLPEESLIAQAIESGNAWWWRAGEGLLVYYLFTDVKPPIPFIQWVVCQPDQLSAFLIDYRRLAGSLGCSQAGWTAPLNPDLDQILSQSGFERSEEQTLDVYEKTEVVR